MTHHRSILLRIEVRPAGKLSRCRHNKGHEIRKGELRFVVKDPGPAGGEKGYCRDCAHAMLAVAARRLEEFEGELGLRVQ